MFFNDIIRRERETINLTLEASTKEVGRPENMVIEVSYQTTSDSKRGHSRNDQSKYFEVDVIPTREAVVRRLRMGGLDFDERTLSIEPCNEDVDTMRRAGYLVFRF
jgi:hypothetical protein